MKRPEVAKKARESKIGYVPTLEARQRMSAASKGRPKSPAHRAALAKALRESDAYTNSRWSGTWPEQVVAAIFEYSDVRFEVQKRIGQKIVDFYLLDSKAVVEVDGVYWHPNGPDKERDDYLLAKGVSHVYHVTDVLLGQMGWVR
jgi:very-short-patch-repair endonuclease